MHQNGFQKHVEVLSLQKPFGHGKAAVFDAQVEIYKIMGRLLFATKRQIARQRFITKDIIPVDRSHHIFNVAGRQAGGVQATDNSANAGAGNAMKRNLHLLQNAQHADVRRAARSAAAEHQTDLPALLRRGEEYGRIIRVK